MTLESPHTVRSAPYTLPRAQARSHPSLKGFVPPSRRDQLPQTLHPSRPSVPDPPAAASHSIWSATKDRSKVPKKMVPEGAHIVQKLSPVYSPR